MKTYTRHFLGQDFKVGLRFTKYKNNQATAIMLTSFDEEGDEDGIFSTCTINIQGSALYEELSNDPSFVVIKDHSENAGTIDFLTENKIIDISRGFQIFDLGMTEAYGYFLTDESKEDMERQFKEAEDE